LTATKKYLFIFLRILHNKAIYKNILFKMFQDFLLKMNTIYFKHFTRKILHGKYTFIYFIYIDINFFK